MKGAMELRDKKVSDAMKPLDEVFMISADAPLNQDVIDRIIATGHSRIPIYRDTRGNIEEVLLTKTLLRLLPKIMSNPLVQLEEKVGDLDTQYELLLLRDDLSLYEALEEFQQRRRHLAVVVAHDSKKQLGIITLEDVIEELLQEELFDETDINEAGVMAITVESPHVVSRAAGLANFVRMQSSPRSPGKISRGKKARSKGMLALLLTCTALLGILCSPQPYEARSYGFGYYGCTHFNELRVRVLASSLLTRVPGLPVPDLDPLETRHSHPLMTRRHCCDRPGGRHVHYPCIKPSLCCVPSTLRLEVALCYTARRFIREQLVLPCYSFVPTAHCARQAPGPGGAERAMSLEYGAAATPRPFNRQRKLAIRG
eukprot:scaffold1446_cov391-Prasinococcus_capsulatus_cf.AAC.33